MKTNNKAKQVIAYYIHHVRKYPHLLAGGLVAVPLTVLVNNYLPPLIAATVLGRLSNHQYTQDVWSSFGPLLVLYAVLAFAGMFTWRLVDAFVWRLEGRVQRDIAREVFDHMTHETADFHANNFGGSLVSHNNKLLSGYVRIADTTTFQVIPLIVGIISVTVILLPRAPLYVGMLLLFAALYIAAALRLSRPVRALSATHSSYESAQTGMLADAITNVLAIKSFARTNFERERYAEATDKTHEGLERFASAVRKQQNQMGSINRSMIALALPIAVISIVHFKANIGTVFLILSYTSSIVDQLFAFSNNTLRNYNRVIGDTTEIVEILQREPEVLDPVRPEKSHIQHGGIRFDDVTFSHNGSDDAIFESLDIDIKDGEKIGLVGHSGSGKTTFTRLLLRFSDIDSGAITIDGQNISKITQDDLHNNIAYVPQESQLFHRTIEENIAYGKLDASTAEIHTAAERANAAEFIEQLQDGYETMVGERGVKLSGGQRQRIAIARAMLKDAPVLLLDEATSALDSESEALIQDALWKLMENKTAIIIAHRLSTIQKMDRIVVLDNGVITEQGTHQELLAKNGTYAKLWARQSGGFIEE